MSIDVQKEWLDHKIRVRDDEGPKPTAFGTPFRISDSGACVRKRTFSAFNARESEEYSPQSYMAFDIGNAVHDSIQKALEEGGNGWHFESEVPIDLTEITKKVGHGVTSFGLSGHCDGIITDIRSGRKTVVELKSVSGYAAKLAWGGLRGAGAGPKREHVAQVSLYAMGVEADAILIVYVSKESDFRSGIRAGDIYQWDFALTEPSWELGDQSPYDIAMQELRDFQLAAHSYDRGHLAPRYVPNDDGKLELVMDPPGYMAKAGNWRCRYCNFNTVCATLEPHEVPIELVDLVEA